MTNTTLQPRNISGLQIFMMMLVVMILSVGITLWVVFSDLFASEFKPVKLSDQEEQVLDNKMRAVGIEGLSSNTANNHTLAPEPYTESNEARNIALSEKEINALLANNTDLANKLAIDLSEGLVSLKFILPLDNELPLLGGKTLKVTAGVELVYRANKPVVILKGVSVWGVPVPNAYLGDLKNIDLVNEFSRSSFWESFSASLEDLNVQEGTIYLKLKK